jgi:hypothetical protein
VKFKLGEVEKAVTLSEDVDERPPPKKLEPAATASSAQAGADQKPPKAIKRKPTTVIATLYLFISPNPFDFCLHREEIRVSTPP